MINRRIWDVALAATIGCLIGLPAGGWLVTSEQIWTTEQLEGITLAESYVLGVAHGQCSEIHKDNSTAYISCMEENMCQVSFGRFAEECARRQGAVTE